LEGENPVVAQIDDPVSLATELARFIKALQKIDTSGAPLSSRGIPLIGRDADTRSSIAELDGMVDASAVTNAWEFALDLAPWSGPSVWIHGDLSPGNLLVLHGRLEAVIDFGSLEIGDPCSDLIIAWNLLPVSARESFKTEMQVDDPTWKRGRGLALSIALIQLPYYAHRNPKLAENAHHVIHEVLADHGEENETKRS